MTIDARSVRAVILAELRRLDAGPDTPETWRRKCDLLRSIAAIVRAEREAHS